MSLGRQSPYALILSLAAAEEHKRSMCFYFFAYGQRIEEGLSDEKLLCFCFSFFHLIRRLHSENTNRVIIRPHELCRKESLALSRGNRGDIRLVVLFSLLLR